MSDLGWHRRPRQACRVSSPRLNFAGALTWHPAAVRPNRRIRAQKTRALLSGSESGRGFGSVFRLQGTNGRNDGHAERSLSSLDGIQAKHQRHRMLRRFLEAIVFVELFGSVMKGVDEQRSNTCVLRNADRTTDCVLQEGCPQLDALSPMINGQPGQNHHRHRIGHVAPHAAGCRLV